MTAPPSHIVLTSLDGTSNFVDPITGQSSSPPPIEGSPGPYQIPYTDSAQSYVYSLDSPRRVDNVFSDTSIHTSVGNPPIQHYLQPHTVSQSSYLVQPTSYETHTITREANITACPLPAVEPKSITRCPSPVVKRKIVCTEVGESWTSRYAVWIFAFLIVLGLVINLFLLARSPNTDRDGRPVHDHLKWSTAVVGIGVTIVVGMLIAAWIHYIVINDYDISSWIFLFLIIIIPLIVTYLVGLLMGVWLNMGHIWFTESAPLVTPVN